MTSSSKQEGAGPSAGGAAGSVGFFPVAGAVEGRGADGSGQVDGLASGPRVRLETWASAAREAASWGPRRERTVKSPPRRVGGAPHAVGSQAARGARPCDVRHHELEVKAVELGVCFSLWGGGGGRLPGGGDGRAARACVIHAAGLLSGRERRGRGLNKGHE